MNTTPQAPTKEEFNNIYTSEEYRNKISYAHQCNDKSGNFLYFSTCDYPTRHRVTAEQIQEATDERIKY